MRETSQLAKRSGLFAGLAVATSVVFQVLMIAAIVLRPEIDPARNPISEYAIGRLGWLAVLGFLASGAAYTCLSLAALVATVTPAEGWPPRLMFLTYAAWMIVIAIKSVGLSRHREPDLVDVGGGS